MKTPLLTSFRLIDGSYFDFLKPDPAMITAENVSHALARNCRYNGHVDFYYSVAEHCILCADHALMDGEGADACLAILLHDACEAFTGDIVKPLKNLLGSAFKKIEDRIDRAIEIAFGVNFEEHREVVKKYDMGVLIAEKNFFQAGDSTVWIGEEDAVKLDVDIRLWRPETAQRMFFKRLKGWLHEREVRKRQAEIKIIGKDSRLASRKAR